MMSDLLAAACLTGKASPCCSVVLRVLRVKFLQQNEPHRRRAGPDDPRARHPNPNPCHRAKFKFDENLGRRSQEFLIAAGHQKPAQAWPPQSHLPLRLSASRSLMSRVDVDPTAIDQGKSPETAQAICRDTAPLAEPAAPPASSSRTFAARSRYKPMTRRSSS